jgi:hypothetical protein
MRATRYFEEQVLRKRPYIRREWCLKPIVEPLAKATQLDGRVRYWIWVPEAPHYLRVVTLEDGVTVHNAFFDRRFGEEI